MNLLTHNPEKELSVKARAFLARPKKLYINGQFVDAGAVWVNCSDVFDPNLPWGGFKQSGWGRELGQEGVEAFTELKAVMIKL
jgi:acyl-CoA reductase-like NAD-dependent aldehyde dehydrogenase